MKVKKFGLKCMFKGQKSVDFSINSSNLNYIHTRLLNLLNMMNEFFSCLRGKILDNISEFIGTKESILAPPKLLNDLIFKEFFQVFDVGLLPESVLEELLDITSLVLCHFRDLDLSFGVMDQQHEGVLVLIILTGAQIEAALNEEILGIFSCGGRDPIIVLSAIHILEFILDECTECSQDLLDKNICLDPWMEFLRSLIDIL